MLCTLLLMFGLALHSLGAAEPPPGVERPSDEAKLRSLIGKPKTTSASVTPIDRGGKVWCATKAECEGVFHEPLDKIQAILRNHEAYPQYFSRITTNTVERHDGRIIEHQVMSLNVLGVIYRNVYTLDGEETVLDNPRRLLNQWGQGASDGTVEGIEGLWYLEEFTMDGDTYTYARYRIKSEVPQIIPGQSGLMMLFLGDSLVQSMLEVIRAAHKS